MRILSSLATIVCCAFTAANAQIKGATAERLSLSLRGSALQPVVAEAMFLSWIPMAKRTVLSGEALAASVALEESKLGTATTAGAYTPSPDERLLLQLMAAQATFLASALAISSDMTNHGAFRRVAQKIVDVLPAVSGAYTVFELAKNIDNAAPELTNAKAAGIVGAVSKGLDVVLLRKLADEAQFVVNSGEKIKSTRTRADTYAANAVAFANRPTWGTEHDYRKELQEANADLLGIARDLRAVLATVPSDYIDSKDQLKRLDDAIRMLERLIS